MATNTTNYNLIKPAHTDTLGNSLDDFNSNADTIDATMHQLQTDLTSLSNNISNWETINVTRNTSVTSSSFENGCKYNAKLQLINISFRCVTTAAISATSTVLATIPTGYRPYRPMPILIYNSNNSVSYKGFISTDGGIKNLEAMAGPVNLYVDAMYRHT